MSKAEQTKVTSKAVAASRVSGRPRGGTVRLRDLGLPSLIPLWIAVGYVMFFVISFYANRGAFGGDAHAYWLTAHHHNLYAVAPTRPDAYLYSPAFAMIIWPIAVLPWPVFLGLWMVAETMCFLWLLAPLGWRWGVPVLMLCSVEIMLGDINAFLALALVLGMCRPGAWAFPLLTKITPGIGPVWFATRREWKSFSIAVLTTVAIAGASWLAAPGQWTQWISFLWNHQSGGILFFPVRAAAALVLTATAAKLHKPWLLAPAMLLAAPVIHNAGVPTVLAAIPRLLAEGNRLRNTTVLRRAATS